MNVLVVNGGSSSLKFQLINYDNRDVLAKGLCERIGIDGRLVYEPKNGEKEVTEAAMPTHVEAIQMVLDALVNEKSGVIKSLEEVRFICEANDMDPEKIGRHFLEVLPRICPKQNE